MLIRPSVPGDVDARVAVHRACIPFSVATPAIMSAGMEEPVETRLKLVAEVGGRVVATAGADLENRERDMWSAGVMVVPEHRGTGVGAALYARVEEHLASFGAGHVTASVHDEAGRGFAERRGYAGKSMTRVSTIDPRTVEAGPVPEGIVIRSASELGDLRAAHELDMLFGPDIPASRPFVPQSYEAWRERFGSVIPLDPDLCLTAFDGDVPVATTVSAVTEDRMLTVLSGTRPDRRHRGLARAVKVAALTAAAAKGMTVALTWNDTTNAPILAANERLGYRPHTLLTIMIKEA